MSYHALLDEIASRAFPEHLSVALYGSSAYLSNGAVGDVDILVIVPTSLPNNRYTLELDGKWYMLYATTREELERDISAQYFGLAVAGKIFFPIEIITGEGLPELQVRARSAVLRQACRFIAWRHNQTRHLQFSKRALILAAALFLCEIAPPTAKAWQKLIRTSVDLPSLFWPDETAIHIDEIVADEVLASSPTGWSLGTATYLSEADGANFELALRRMSALNAAETVCRGWRPLSRWADTLHTKYDQILDFAAVLRQIASAFEEECNACSFLR